jgi:hypothetical protein
MQVLQARTSAAATVAGRCADDLRALTDGAPEAVGRALANDGATGRLPGGRQPAPAELARRSRQEIDRRERDLHAGLSMIANAVEVGPAALDRALAATARSQDVGRSLCDARDTASAIALMTHGRSWRGGEAVSAAR